MVKINNLEIGRPLSRDNRIATHRSLFGLVSRTVFIPTGSPVTAFLFEYTADKGELIERMLKSPESQLPQHAKSLRTLRSNAIGNTRLEVCLSADHQFAAAQLFRYSDFLPSAITPLVIYEGQSAETIASLL